jgi:hypothetical protein
MGNSDEWGGLYLWDSQASLGEFVEIDLRNNIAETYQSEGAPPIETTAVIDARNSRTTLRLSVILCSFFADGIPRRLRRYPRHIRHPR